MIVQRRAVALARLQHDLPQRDEFDTLLGEQALGDLQHSPCRVAFDAIFAAG